MRNSMSGRRSSAIPAAGRTTEGPWSPPIASRATLTSLAILRPNPPQAPCSGGARRRATIRLPPHMATEAESQLLGAGFAPLLAALRAVAQDGERRLARAFLLRRNESHARLARVGVDA